MLWQSCGRLGNPHGVCQPFPLPSILIPGCVFTGRLKFMGILICRVLPFYVKNCSNYSSIHSVSPGGGREGWGCGGVETEREQKLSKTRENNPLKLFIVYSFHSLS